MPRTAYTIFRLIDERERGAALVELARQLGCEQVVLFVSDPGTGRPLPLEETEDADWQPLLESTDGPAPMTQGRLLHPGRGTPEDMAILRTERGATLVTIGGRPRPSHLLALRPYVDLLSIAMRTRARSAEAVAVPLASSDADQLYRQAVRGHADERTQDELRARADMAVRHAMNLRAEVSRLNEVARRAGLVKEDFLATLSHELRTPLNAMLGWLQLLRLHLSDPAEREHALDVIERNARAQAQIIEDLLDASRAITGQMRLVFERVDLADVVRSGTGALVPAAKAKHVRLTIETGRIEGTIYGDPARLRQVVWNLVNNAVKFTPEGGSVAVRVSRAETHAAIEVTDTGIGIRPDLLPHVFERFQQGDSSVSRAFGGLGLGLAIVRHLVELHGGSVSATSEGDDQGSRFIVRLPLSPVDVDEQVPPASTDSLVSEH